MKQLNQRIEKAIPLSHIFLKQETMIKYFNFLFRLLQAKEWLNEKRKQQSSTHLPIVIIGDIVVEILAHGLHHLVHILGLALLLGNGRHWNLLLRLLENLVEGGILDFLVLVNELSEWHLLEPSVRNVLDNPGDDNDGAASDNAGAPFTSADWVSVRRKGEPVDHDVLEEAHDADDKPEPEVELGDDLWEHVELVWSNLSAVDVIEHLKEDKCDEDDRVHVKLHLSVPVFIAVFQQLPIFVVCLDLSQMFDWIEFALWFRAQFCDLGSVVVEDLQVYHQWSKNV